MTAEPHPSASRSGRAHGPTFSELAAAMLADAEREGLAASTLRGYRAALRHHLLPRLGDRAIAEVDEAELRGLIAALRANGLSENGVVDVLKPLRRTLALATRGRLIDVNPYARLEGKPTTVRDRHRMLAIGEIEALAEAADEPTGIAIGLALFCGVRNAEARALTVGDFDRDALTIRVPRRAPPRREWRAARAHPPDRTVDGLDDAFGFLRSLRDHVAARELRPKDPLVRTVSGQRWDRGNLSRRYGSALRRAGLTNPSAPRLTFEQLRHNFIAIAARTGTDPITLLRQLGTAQLQTLQGFMPYFDQPRLRLHVRERLAIAAERLCRGS